MAEAEKETPRSFKDNRGRSWIVSITANDLKRVRLATGIKLGSLTEDQLKPLAELLSDTEQFIDVLYLLCQEQAEKIGASDADFGRAMVGDHIDDAATAFLRALADFSPSRVRTTLLNLAEKGLIAVERLGAKAAKELESITPEMIEGAIESMLKNSAANSRGSVGSIPAPLLSAN